MFEQFTQALDKRNWQFLEAKCSAAAFINFEQTVNYIIFLFILALTY